MEVIDAVIMLGCSLVSLVALVKCIIDITVKIRCVKCQTSTKDE